MPFGIPQSGEGERLTYGGYLKIPEILSLQQLLSNPPSHDEMLFIIIHQVYELWFKELLHELDAVIRYLHGDAILDAHRLLRRCIEIGRVLVGQIAVLETMTPIDFLDFRDNLMPASGFQSAQFREIEYVSGLRDRRFIRNYPEGSAERARLEKRLAEESLWEAFCVSAARRGFGIGKDPSGDGSVPELKRLYENPHAHYDLFLLCENLIEYDEMFLQWRVTHVKMVERMIGSKTGTGGSEGVGYLRTTLDRKFFPVLWTLRTHLSKKSAL